MIKINKIFNSFLSFCYYVIVAIMLISDFLYLLFVLLFVSPTEIIEKLLLVYPVIYGFIVLFIIYGLLYLF